MRQASDIEMISEWPPETVAMGILITTSLLSFLLVGTGLAYTSWQLLKERNTQSSESDPQHRLQDNGVHDMDSELNWITGMKH